MNVIGEIGNFIMTYQEEIQIVAIGCGIALAVFGIGKAIANGKKKRALLEQIHENVSEINSNVKRLSEKRTEVIYIDGRVAPMGSVDAAGAAPQAASTAEPVKCTTEEEKKTEEPEVEKTPAMKYFSRDCGLAKDGRQYTLEELNEQIRD